MAATGVPLMSWSICWSSAGTWKRYVPGPKQANGLPLHGSLELLVQHGDVEGLRTQVATGDGHAATQLARLLAERGDLDGAVQVLLDAQRTPETWRLQAS